MTAMEIKEFNIEEVESLEAPMDWGAFAAGGGCRCRSGRRCLPRLLIVPHFYPSHIAFKAEEPMKNNSELMFEELEMQNEMMSDSDIMIILGAAAVAVKIIVVFT